VAVTRDPNYTPFGPRFVPVVERPVEALWELRGAGRVITCALLDHGDVGVEVQMFENRQFVSGQRFPSRDDAIVFANQQRPNDVA
jgi:hypothetical protein